MPTNRKLTIAEAKAEIEEQLRRKEKIQAFIDEQALWLRTMERFTGDDEQQHIVGDISQGERQIEEIDERVRQLQSLLGKNHGSAENLP